MSRAYPWNRRLWGKMGVLHELEWQTDSQNRSSLSVLSFFAKQFFCLSFFRPCDVLKGLCSLSFVTDMECHYEWTGVRVGVVFTLENLRAGENKKNWATSLKESETRESKSFLFSSHFTSPRRFRSSEKQIANGNGRINKATARQQCSILPLEGTHEEKFD